MVFQNLNTNIIIIFIIIGLSLSEETQKNNGFSLFFQNDKYSPKSETTENNEIIRNIKDNNIYTKLNIGTPKQEINFYFHFNEYITYITQNSFDKSSSSSFSFLRENKQDEEEEEENNKKEFSPFNYTTEELHSGYESKDSLELPNKKSLNNFNFILADTLYYDKHLYKPVIGLNLPEKDSRKVLNDNNFIEQLKINNLIDKRLFTVLYGKNMLSYENIDKYDGEILFGKFPHEVSSSFNENELMTTNAEIDGYHNKWKLKFNSISYANEVLENKDTEIVLEQNLILGPSEMRKKLLNNFFNKYLSNGICKEEKFVNPQDRIKYYYYSCDPSSIQFDSKENILSFKSVNLNETFTLTFEELFLKYNNRVFFGIFFDEYEMYGWKLGRLFLQKYPLMFSVDNKAIGYYKKGPIIYDNSDNKLIITLSIIIAILCLLLFIGGKKYTFIKSLLPRTKKANELNDDYSYIESSSTSKPKTQITTEMMVKNPDKNELGY